MSIETETRPKDYRGHPRRYGPDGTPIHRSTSSPTRSGSSVESTSETRNATTRPVALYVGTFVVENTSDNSRPSFVPVH